MSKRTYESGSSERQKATSKADALRAVITRTKTIIKFFSVPQGSTPKMALATLQCRPDLSLNRHGKDSVHPFDRQGAVYCVPCDECDQKYFGETKRSSNTRNKDHIKYVKHFYPETTALAKHALELEHRMNWSKTQIVAFENDFRKRRFIESFFINSTPNAFNKESSDLFLKIYKATFGYNYNEKVCLTGGPKHLSHLATSETSTWVRTWM